MNRSLNDFTDDEYLTREIAHQLTAIQLDERTFSKQIEPDLEKKVQDSREMQRDRESNSYHHRKGRCVVDRVRSRRRRVANQIYVR